MDGKRQPAMLAAVFEEPNLVEICCGRERGRLTGKFADLISARPLRRILWQRLRSQYRNDLKAGCGEMARSRSVLGIFRAVSKPWRIERFRKIQAGRNAGDLSFGKRSDPGAGRNRETGTQPWNSLCLHCSERRQSAGTVLRCGDCKALRERAGLALD